MQCCSCGFFSWLWKTVNLLLFLRAFSLRKHTFLPGNERGETPSAKKRSISLNMWIHASCMTFLVVLVWLISLRQQTFNWTGLLWRIKQIKEGVIHRGQRPRWITPSEKHARNTLLKHAYLLAASMLSIFDSVRLDLSSSVKILQIADVALRVVFLLFLLRF